MLVLDDPRGKWIPSRIQFQKQILVHQVEDLLIDDKVGGFLSWILTIKPKVSFNISLQYLSISRYDAVTINCIQKFCILRHFTVVFGGYLRNINGWFEGNLWRSIIILWGERSMFIVLTCCFCLQYLGECSIYCCTYFKLM